MASAVGERLANRSVGRGGRPTRSEATRRHQHLLDVAGAMELAGAVRLAVDGTRRFDGYVALGCVVKGQTDHYEHVCREAMRGLTQVALHPHLAEVELLNFAPWRDLAT